MSYEHYRESKLGDALVDALGELVSEEKISQELAIKVLIEVRSMYLAASILPLQRERAWRGPLAIASPELPSLPASASCRLRQDYPTNTAKSSADVVLTHRAIPIHCGAHMFC